MNTKSPAIPVKNMVIIALFTALLCVVSPFSINIGPIPLSFATLVIYLTAGTLNWKNGTISVLLYIMLGAFGLPVFSGFGAGFQKIAGPTGGFIIGYIPLALVTGLSAKTLDKNRFIQFTSGEKGENSASERKALFSASRWLFIPGMAIGTVLLYTCGVFWFMVQAKASLITALMACVVPFLIGDTIKIIIAFIITPQLRASLRFSRK